MYYFIIQMLVLSWYIIYNHAYYNRTLILDIQQMYSRFYGSVRTLAQFKVMLHKDH